ncbi:MULTISPECIES: hypothetical protein, partial [unclassified Microcoleus]|uniref:hypothetical protein n=1 Tax=unclassified Microcoleus TaxID=2642155 RepID=UPI0025FDD13A
ASHLLCKNHFFERYVVALQRSGSISFVVQKPFFLQCCPQRASCIILALRGHHYNNKTEIIPALLYIRKSAEAQLRTFFKSAQAQLPTFFKSAQAQLRTFFKSAQAQLRTFVKSAQAQLRTFLRALKRNYVPLLRALKRNYVPFLF